jgi:tripartite ATP-independent transporter DctM subunit
LSGARRGLELPVTGALAAAAGVLGSLWTGVVALAALWGVPLFAVMAGGAALAWRGIGEPLNRLAPKVLEEQFAGSPVLVTIPLFTLLGFVLAESKAPARIVRAALALLGWMPGGLAVVCLGASAFFTTLTGGSGVTIVAIGGLLYPALLAQGYPERFSLGLVTTGGSLGLLLPPSLPILVYALVTGLDFKAAFLAGLLPGALVLALLGAYAASVGVRAKVARARPNLRELVAALDDLKYELLIPVLILGGLATSLTSLDESAALALAWTGVVEFVIHGDLSWRNDAARIVKQAIALAGAVILILMMANGLMNFVTTVKLPQRVLEGLLGLGLTERWQFLVVLNLFLLVVGMVMDGFSAILVAVPLVQPFAVRFGLQPFHLAMMFILNLELAFCLPPLGLNLFIASFRFRKPVTELYRAVLPFAGLLAVALVGVMAVPWLSTALVQPTIARAREEAARLQVPPRDAWMLECVQDDVTHPRPCTEAERKQYDEAAAPADDEGLDPSLMDALMKP